MRRFRTMLRDVFRPPPVEIGSELGAKVGRAADLLMARDAALEAAHVRQTDCNKAAIDDLLREMDRKDAARAP